MSRIVFCDRYKCLQEKSPKHIYMPGGRSDGGDGYVGMAQKRLGNAALDSFSILASNHFHVEWMQHRLLHTASVGLTDKSNCFCNKIEQMPCVNENQKIGQLSRVIFFHEVTSASTPKISSSIWPPVLTRNF